MIKYIFVRVMIDTLNVQLPNEGGGLQPTVSEADSTGMDREPSRPESRLEAEVEEEVASRSKATPMLGKRQRSENSARKVLECPHCGKQFHKVNKLNRHIDGSHENKRPFVCDDPSGCQEAFKRKDHLIRHKVSKHATEKERESFPCPYRKEGCLMSFPNRDQQRKHVKRKHLCKLMCEKCQKQADQDLSANKIDRAAYDRIVGDNVFHKKN